uniref:Tubulin-tyrosine ligase n=1 Tax=Mucochytrium quahogii TaxID=96639 RepID=A0A7S2SNY1_9STRA|mmetsp:Transcript_3623/g.6945  ORF Transcript_3623/g.6945 Transcript_3623/m.6945 type:complete len:394 (-) Transcript_3623:1367-2548(-)
MVAFTYYVSKHEISWIPFILDDYRGVGEKIGLEGSGITFRRVDETSKGDFAWVHTPNQDSSKCYSEAKVRGGNAVSGTHVLEDKFKLALLNQKTQSNIESLVFIGAAQVERWAAKYWSTDTHSDQLWMVKDSGANCGDGLFVTGRSNWSAVVEELHASERQSKRTIRFVIQKYIENPELWKGKFKYHIRMYVVVRGDLSAYLHSTALVHVANKPYNVQAIGLSDKEIHLTNVSKNHHNEDLFHGCPIVHLRTYLGDDRMNKVLRLFRETFESARPYMMNQKSPFDFSHIGADIMFDQAGEPYLLECNIPPCIGNYGDDMLEEQHHFFRDLFYSMTETFAVSVLDKNAKRQTSMWETIIGCSPPELVKYSEELVGLNKLSWTLFEKKAVKKQML